LLSLAPDKNCQSGTDCENLSQARLYLRRLYRCFVYQKDGDVVTHGVDPLAAGALQTLRILPHFEGMFACGADQNFEQVLGNHGSILRDAMPASREITFDVPSTGALHS